MKTASTLVLLLCASTVSAGPISGLVGYWPADDETANDQSGNNNDGVFRNGATTSSGGVVGQAFSFDGINDWVEFGHPATGLDDLQEITVATWVYHNSLPPGKTERYVTLPGLAGEKAATSVIIRKLGAGGQI